MTASPAHGAAPLPVPGAVNRPRSAPRGPPKSKFFNQLNVFRCYRSLLPPFWRFRRKPASRVCRASNSVFCLKSLQIPARCPLPLDRLSPRTRLNVRQPAEVVCPPSLSPLRLRFCFKKRLKQSSRRVRFCVRLQVECPSLQIRRFSVESGLQTPLCSVFCFRAGKAANSSPPSVSPLVTALSPLRHRSSPLRHRLSPLCHHSLWGRKVRKKKPAKPAPRLRWVCKSWLILPVVICLSQSRS